MVDLLRTFNGIAAQRLAGLCEMDTVAAPAGQAFAPGEQTDGVGLSQACRQGHGVGVAAKKLEPDPFAGFRRLIRQHADHLAFLQGLDQCTYARNIGGGEVQVGTFAAHENEFLAGSKFGRAIEHGDVAERREILRGDLEAAEMRGQKDDALAFSLCCLDQLQANRVDDQCIGLSEGAHPDAREFEHLLARFSGGGPANFSGQTRLRDVGAQVAAIGRRKQVNEPSEQVAQCMQNA